MRTLEPSAAVMRSRDPVVVLSALHVPM